MPWWVNPLVFFVLVLAIGLLGTALMRLRATRSIANWMGTGVHEGLEPDEAALLLRRHPSAIVMIRCLMLEAAGRVRITSDIPLRVEWVGGEPGNPVEAAFATAMDGEGRFREKKVFEILEAMYGHVNEEMLLHGGRATAVFYSERTARMLVEYIDHGGGDPVVVPWLLLGDTDRKWEFIRDDPVGVALKRAARLKNRAIDRLVSDEAYHARVRGCNRRGFFRWRKDLLRARGRPPRPAWYR